MRKLSFSRYGILGTVVMLFVAIFCSVAFMQGNLKQAAEKADYEWTYDNAIDFIVPGPSFSQVEELEKEDNGIAVVTPYAETKATFSLNQKAAEGTVLLFPYGDKMKYTPYSEKSVIEGNHDTSGGSALVDKSFYEKNGCAVGDIVTISVFGHNYSFTIKAITKTNNYYDGTLALILTDTDFAQMKKDGIKYSAAYINASDVNKCRNFLNTSYKPLSRLKERSAFSSDDVYKQHVDNFNSADWSKEITDCHDNYLQTSVKYVNIDPSIRNNIIAMSVVLILVILAFNTMLLRSDKLQQKLKKLMAKDTTVKDIQRFYCSGIRMNTIVLCIALVLLYLYDAKIADAPYLSVNILNCIIPAAVAIVFSWIMRGICSVSVKRTFATSTENSVDLSKNSIKKDKPQEKKQEKKQEELKDSKAMSEIIIAVAMIWELLKGSADLSESSIADAADKLRKMLKDGADLSESSIANATDKLRKMLKDGADLSEGSIASAADKLKKILKDGTALNEISIAAVMLREMLKDGAVPCDEIFKRMNAVGINERSVEKAKKELGVKSFRKEKVWFWQI